MGAALVAQPELDIAEEEITANAAFNQRSAWGGYEIAAPCLVTGATNIACEGADAIVVLTALDANARRVAEGEKARCNFAVLVVAAVNVEVAAAAE